jgi:hypothetical protein
MQRGSGSLIDSHYNYVCSGNARFAASEFAKSVYAVGTVAFKSGLERGGRQQARRRQGITACIPLPMDPSGTSVKYVLGGGEQTERNILFPYNDERGTKEVDEEEQGPVLLGARKSIVWKTRRIDSA